MKRQPKKTALRPVLGWVGVINVNELDLDCYATGSGHKSAYGVVYPTRKEALNFYQRARRVIVKPY